MSGCPESSIAKMFYHDYLTEPSKFTHSWGRSECGEFITTLAILRQHCGTPCEYEFNHKGIRTFEEAQKFIRRDFLVRLIR